jgi:alpha-D-xyloside xylohydrolase
MGTNSAGRRLLPLLVGLGFGCGTDPVGSDGLRCDDTCLDWDGAALTLMREGEPVLRLPLSGIQIGLVDAYSDSLSYDPWYDDTSVDWEAAIAANATRDADGSLRLDLEFEDGSKACLEAGPGEDGRFALELLPTEGGTVAYMQLAADLDADQAVYGLGEFFDTVDQQGQRRPLQVEVDGALESLYNEAHVPVPLAIGTLGWGWFVEDRHPMVVDVGATDPGVLSWTIGLGPEAEAGLRFHLYTKAEPIDLVLDYYRTTGFPVLPDPWALGPLLWRDENTGQSQVQEDIDALRALDLPASGIWIDRPYATGVNTFDFDADKYDDPAAMVAYAQDRGLRVGLWHTPYVSADEAPELNLEAETNGYFPPETGLNLNGWGTPIDFSNPDAVSWWQGLLANYADIGIEGYKLDYGEDIALGLNGGLGGWVFADGTDARTMHKRYAALYHQAYTPTLPESGGFLLCRAGTWGDQLDARIIWPGDLAADLSRHGDPIDGESGLSVGGLHAAVVAGLSLGVSGFPLFGSDTGGYRRSPPNRETFIRWFQQTTWSPVMQVGNSASGQPWELLEGEDLDLYRDLSRLHLRLFPTLWTYAKRVATDGRPILRPLRLVYPTLSGAPSQEYLLGDWLLVTPVVDAGATTQDVLFPPGRWLQWFNFDVVDGGQTLAVDAPLEMIPVYLAEGGMVPLLRSTIDTLSPVVDPDEIDSFDSDPGVLTVRWFPGPSTSFEVYDGTELTQDQEAPDGAATFTVTPGSVFDSGVLLEVVGFAAGSVTVDGSAVTVEEEDGVVRVELGPGTHEVVLSP